MLSAASCLRWLAPAHRRRRRGRAARRGRGAGRRPPGARADLPALPVRRAHAAQRPARDAASSSAWPRHRPAPSWRAPCSKASRSRSPTARTRCATPAPRSRDVSLIGGGARSRVLGASILASVLERPLRCAPAARSARRSARRGSARLAADREPRSRRCAPRRRSSVVRARSPRCASLRSRRAWRGSARSIRCRCDPLFRHDREHHHDRALLRRHRPDPLRGPDSADAAGVPLLRQGPRRARQAHGRPPALRRLLLAHLLLARLRPVRRDGTLRAPLARRRRRRWRWPRAKADAAFEFFARLGAPFFTLPRSRRRARGRDAARDQRTSSTACVERARSGTMAAHRREAAVGHGQPVLPPPLHGRRGDQPRSGGLRLRRRAGEEGDGGHPPARRRELRAVGRPRGLRDAAQHRPARGARPARPLHAAWSSSTSTRSASRARS